MNSLFVFASIQSLLFVLLLLLKKGKKKNDIILLYWFLFFAVHLIYPIFVFYDYPGFISFSGLDAGLFVVHLMFLDFYISSIVGKNRKIYFSGLLLLSTIVGAAFFVSPYLLMGIEKRTKLMTGQNSFPLLMLIGVLILFGTAFYYLYSSFKKLRIFRLEVRQQVSNMDGLMLKWVDITILSIFIYFSLVVFFFLLMLITPVQPHTADYAVYTGLVLLVFWMGFSGIKQGSVFISDLKTGENPGNITIRKKPDQKDSLFGEQVRDIMEKQKIFLDNEIRMSQLAEMLAVSPQHLSFILNSVIKMNFYDFINSYRIKEVCSRIESGDAEEMTILAIALDSGFNSKATFNRLFKKHMGMNPSDYRKKTISASKNGLN